MRSKDRRAVFLDRDGTLIRNQPYGHDPDAIQFTAGAVEGLRLLRAAGFRLAIVTNQSGIARAYFTEEHLHAMHRRLRAMLAEEGVVIDGIYFCPHHPNGSVPEFSTICDCRKPNPGMLLRACAEMHIDPESSWMIGDILDDVEAGNRAGCRTILVDVGTEKAPERPVRRPDYVARDLLDATRYLLRESGRSVPAKEATFG